MDAMRTKLAEILSKLTDYPDTPLNGVLFAEQAGQFLREHGATLATTLAAREDGCSLIAAERRRQVEAEGWTPEHDDEHVEGELAAAAACYAMPAHHALRDDCTPPLSWPWDESWWKPGERVRELVKAGALIAAEIDRLIRAAVPPAQVTGEGDG